MSFHLLEILLKILPKIEQERVDVRKHVVKQFTGRPPPPRDLSFWSFLTFLHHGIEGVERHLL